MEYEEFVKKRKEPRAKTPEQALNSLMALCSRAERSSGDAKRLMERWGVPKEAIEGVLERLKSERYIDDSRYAELYVREKVNVNGWGARKISQGLRLKGVAQEIVAQAIEEIEPDKLRERLEERVKRKLRTTKYKSRSDLKWKLVKFTAAQGYDYSLSVEVIEEILTTLDIEEQEEWDV